MLVSTNPALVLLGIFPTENVLYLAFISLVRGEKLQYIVLIGEKKQDGKHSVFLEEVPLGQGLRQVSPECQDTRDANE